MKNRFRMLSVFCVAVLFLAGSGQEKPKTATVELPGNLTTGYTWVYTMSPADIMREVSKEYIPDQVDEDIVGSGGKFIFTFKPLAKGEAKLVFSYLRVWEEDTPPLETVVFRATVDDQAGLTLAPE